MLVTAPPAPTVARTVEGVRSALQTDPGTPVRADLRGGVVVDGGRRVARLPAGTCWSALAWAAARHGLMAPLGGPPAADVVADVLGGGWTYSGRAHGLAANAVRAVELIRGDGELVRADADTDPQLLWALRGGGEGFGVVTAIELELLPTVPVVSGAALWPGALAEPLMAAWRRWTITAPREITTSLRLLDLPPLPGFPEGPVACVEGAVLGTDDGAVAATAIADELLRHLRAVGAPVLDTWRMTTPERVGRVRLAPGLDGVSVRDHLLLHELGDEGVVALLHAAGSGATRRPVLVELRQLGGAFAAPDVPGGALDRTAARFAYLGHGTRAEHAGVRAALQRWNTGRTLPSLTGRRDHGSLGATFGPGVALRVQAVRERLDPMGRFSA